MKAVLPELLAPAGTYEALVAAVAAGADAVYTGAGAFNARVGARDLDIDELERGARLAHDHGARIYVTLNVYVRDEELDGAVELARSVLSAGADALIVADTGLIARLRREIPGVEIHLSTQAGVHAPEGALLAARELGVSRVTCGRELSIDEIASMAATGVEIEAFCHGAICVCYAGACGFSAHRRGRSANRGDCTQPCRMHYALEDAQGARVDAREGDMLLCPRDYLSIRHVPRLVAAGAGALKVEGRMKNPDYVYNVVRCYRLALDAVAGDHAVDLEGLEAQLARSFNRGFSVEYLEGRSGAGLMSWERSCNQGLLVGHVTERRYEEVVIAFDRAVSAGDTLEIRFYPGEDSPSDVPKRWPMVPCPSDAMAGERLVVHCKRKVDAGSEVYVVRSARVLKEARDAIRSVDPCAGEGLPGGRANSGRKRRPALGEEPPAPAAGASLAREASVKVVPADTDRSRPQDGGRGGAPACIQVVDTPVRAGELLAVARPGDAVAVHAERLLEKDAGAWEVHLPKLLVILDEVSREGDEERQRMLCRRAAGVVCRNLTQVAYARQEGACFEVAAPITVCNAESALELARLGARRVWIADEAGLDTARCVSIAVAGKVPIAVRLSGRSLLMVTEHCVLTSEGPCAESCADCPRRLSARYLVERDGARLPVHVDALGRTRIYDAEVRDHTGEAARLRAFGAGAFTMVCDL